MEGDRPVPANRRLVLLTLTMSERALLNETTGSVRPLRVVEPQDVRDLCLQALTLFGIPAVPRGNTAIDFPDDLDDRDADLQHAVLRLVELRFPTLGDPRSALVEPTHDT